MNTKENTAWFFAICLFVLLGLQGFYIYNSYLLQEKDLVKQARESATQISTSVNNDKWHNEKAVVNHFSPAPSAMEQISIVKENLKKEFSSKKLRYLIQKEKEKSGFDLALKTQIVSIYDNIQQKELLKSNEPIILYQTKKTATKPQQLEESTWDTEHYSKDTDKNIDQKSSYKILTKSEFQLLNARELVFRKVLPLILVSALILGFLIWVFNQTLINIRHQELKIIQLHTTIDSIAHELNTPISTMKFVVSSLQNLDLKTTLNKQISRIEAVTRTIQLTQKDMVLLSENFIEDFFSEIKEKCSPIKIQNETIFKQNRLLTEEDFLLIMNNLIENSSKYGARNIFINLDFQNTIKISVSDDGIGIPNPELNHIFEKYYRVPRKENLEVNGLGLGLYLVSETVKKYNGEIFVKNNSKMGVKFLIELPQS